MIWKTKLGAALVVGIGLLLGTGTPVSAQPVDWGTGGWEVAAFTGQLNDEPEWGPQRGGDQFLNDAIYGGRAGYVFPANLFLQGEAAISFPEVQPRDGGPRVTSRTYLLGGSVGYNVQPTRRLQLFVSGGAEAVVWNPDGFESETDLGLKYGTGARVYVTPDVAVRGDVRWHQVRNALQEARAEALGVSSAAEDDLWAMEISGGVSVFLGGPEDSDDDGVYDEADACADTPERVIVNDRGCPVDGDTDGVPDGMDRCPDTERGAEVDDEGCPLDSDGDRIVDGLDECPETPGRAVVDETGCPSDPDGDGVLAGVDACPETPRGAEIDDRGCPTGALGVLLRDFLPELNRLTVWFDFAESELWENSLPALKLLGKALVQNPELAVEIQGHADAIGPTDVNRQLARDRAQAVRAYLMENYADVEASQLGVRSLGESQPAVPSESAASRQKNRRAMVVVVEPEPGAETGESGKP